MRTLKFAFIATCLFGSQAMANCPDAETVGKVVEAALQNAANDLQKELKENKHVKKTWKFVDMEDIKLIEGKEPNVCHYAIKKDDQLVNIIGIKLQKAE
jgi:hypothetical protein